MTSRDPLTLQEINARPYVCTNCGWQGMHAQRIWSVPRGYICPQCYETTTQPGKEFGRPKISKVKEVAEKIRAACLRIGTTQREIAEQIGITEVELSHAVSGRRPVRPKIAVRMARVLDLDEVELVTAERIDALERARAELRGEIDDDGS